MGSEISAQATPSARGRFSLPRFPASWAVGSATAERRFARLLWLLVPLQYYVVTHMPRGLSGDDLIPAVALSLMSVVAIFVLSCIAAWLASALWPLDKEQGYSLTGRVRMWVVALMIGTAGGYLLLALSLVVIRVAAKYEIVIYGDLVTGGLTRLLRIWELDYQTTGAFTFPLQTVSNFVYAFAALLVIMLLHRALRRGPASPATQQEPGAISVGLLVAVVMTAANYVASMD